MNRDASAVGFAILFMGLSTLLSSTVLNSIAIWGVKPDLSLVILVFVATRRGSMVGQVGGFTAGLIDDLLSLAPIGFHACVRTVVGFLSGLLEGYILIDLFLVPIVLTIAGTILKGVIAAILRLLFTLEMADYSLISGIFWLEVAYNAVCAPLLYLALGTVKALKPRKKKETA